MTDECTYCGTAIDNPDAVVCPQCGVKLEFVPWEHPSTGSWLARWWRTCVMGMKNPLGLFRQLRPAGSIGSAIGFFALCAVVQSMIAPMITMQVTGSIAQRLIGAHGALDGAELSFGGDPFAMFDDLPGRPRSAEAGPRNDPIKLPVGGGTLMTALSAVASGFGLILAFVTLFSLAGMFQLGAMLFIPERKPFAETLRVTAYAHAPAVCAIVPGIGQLVFAVWMSYLWYVGLREVHHTTNGRLILAMTIVPLVLAIIVGIGCLALVAQLATML